MENNLSQTQHHVLAQISAGSTILDAALSAGVHRNTVGYWLRTDPDFRQAMADAQLTEILLWRQLAESHVESAFNTINEIRLDPKVPAAVRLKAAQIIIERACAPLPLPPHTTPDPEPENVHNSAQNNPQPTDSKPVPSPQADVRPFDAPRTLRESPKPLTPASPASPKVGRNDRCPCGSGLKFKRCHLGKPLPNTPARP